MAQKGIWVHALPGSGFLPAWNGELVHSKVARHAWVWLLMSNSVSNSVSPKGNSKRNSKRNLHHNLIFTTGRKSRSTSFARKLAARVLVCLVWASLMHYNLSEARQSHGMVFLRLYGSVWVMWVRVVSYAKATPKPGQATPKPGQALPWSFGHAYSCCPTVPVASPWGYTT